MYVLYVLSVLVPVCAVLSCWRMASVMGIIMAVVAVLEIHMDRNHVASIRPSINLDKKLAISVVLTNIFFNLLVIAQNEKRVSDILIVILVTIFVSFSLNFSQVSKINFQKLKSNCNSLFPQSLQPVLELTILAQRPRA